MLVPEPFHKIGGLARALGQGVQAEPRPGTKTPGEVEYICPQCTAKGYYGEIGYRRGRCTLCNRFYQGYLRRRTALAYQVLTPRQREEIDKAAFAKAYKDYTTKPPKKTRNKIQNW